MGMNPQIETLLNGINDFLHLSGIYEVSWLCYWSTQLLLASSIYLPAFIILWVFDGLRGRFWPSYNEPHGRSILVTGCDSGFGHDFAAELVAKGWRVYAGCLTEAGMAALTERVGTAGTALLVPLKMDVTKQEDIDAAVARVKADGAHLYAVVNNAGVGRGAPVAWTPMSEYRSIMEVNFFALVSVCKAFLPLLHQTRGRFVNMSSAAGLAAAPMMSCYSASKHAVEAFSMCLRAECDPFGVKVVVVNPSFHKTAIATNALGYLRKAFEALSPEERAYYGEDFYNKSLAVCERFTMGSWDPKNVVKALHKATLLVSPSPQYLVGMDCRFEFIPLVMLPVQMQMDAVKAAVFRNFVPAVYQKGGRFFGREKEMELPPAQAPAAGNGNGAH